MEKYVEIPPNIVEVKRRYDGYSCIRTSYKSDSQEYALMVIEEFYDHDGNIYHATILFSIE